LDWLRLEDFGGGCGDSGDVGRFLILLVRNLERWQRRSGRSGDIGIGLPGVEVELLVIVVGPIEFGGHGGNQKGACGRHCECSSTD
jgi:hypothetical protein